LYNLRANRLKKSNVLQIFESAHASAKPGYNNAPTMPYRLQPHIDFDSRLYNTLTLPCELVMSNTEYNLEILT